jgi:hypothetical protein
MTSLAEHGPAGFLVTVSGSAQLLRVGDLADVMGRGAKQDLVRVELEGREAGADFGDDPDGDVVHKGKVRDQSG